MKKRKNTAVDELTQEVIDNEKPETIMEEFSDLKNRAGWKRLVEAIDIKIKKYEASILDSEIQGEELNRERDRRDLCLWFRNAPDILIGSINRTTKLPDVNLDPYENRKIEIVDNA